MSWKIVDVTVDPVTMDINVAADFDVSGVVKASAILKYQGDHGLSQQAFNELVQADLDRANPEAIKDQATKDSETAAAKTALQTEADDFVAANMIDGTYKLKDLTG